MNDILERLYWCASRFPDEMRDDATIRRNQTIADAGIEITNLRAELQRASISAEEAHKIDSEIIENIRAELESVKDARDLWQQCEASCKTQYDKLSAEYNTLRTALSNIRIEVERPTGRWVHLKRIVSLQCNAALSENY